MTLLPTMAGYRAVHDTLRLERALHGDTWLRRPVADLDYLATFRTLRDTFPTLPGRLLARQIAIFNAQCADYTAALATDLYVTTTIEGN